MKLKLPEFLDSRYMKVVMSALRMGTCPWYYFLLEVVSTPGP